MIDEHPVGLIAQLVERCLGIVESMGSNSVQARIFDVVLFHCCFSCVYNCDDQSCLHIFLRSSNVCPL